MDDSATPYEIYVAPTCHGQVPIVMRHWRGLGTNDYYCFKCVEATIEDFVKVIEDEASDPVEFVYALRQLHGLRLALVTYRGMQ